MRSRGLGCDRGASETVVIPTRDRVSAGQALAGEVLGGLGPVTISLIHIEQTPSGDDCARAGRRLRRRWHQRPTRPHPTPASSSTSQRMRCRAGEARNARSPTHCSLAPTTTRWQRTPGRRSMSWLEEQAHVKPRVDRFDRFIAGVPARLFHIELHDAVLAGDGYIAGGSTNTADARWAR